MNEYECDCSCHSGKKKHAISCCAICSLCGKKIKNKFIETHRAICASARDPVEPPSLEDISKALQNSKKNK